MYHGVVVIGRGNWPGIVSRDGLPNAKKCDSHVIRSHTGWMIDHHHRSPSIIAPAINGAQTDVGTFLFLHIQYVFPLTVYFRARNRVWIQKINLINVGNVA